MDLEVGWKDFYEDEIDGFYRIKGALTGGEHTGLREPLQEFLYPGLNFFWCCGILLENYPWRM